MFPAPARGPPALTVSPILIANSPGAAVAIAAPVLTAGAEESGVRVCAGALFDAGAEGAARSPGGTISFFSAKIASNASATTTAPAPRALVRHLAPGGGAPVA